MCSDRVGDRNDEFKGNMESKATELLDRLDLGSESKGEGVSTMMPRFLACAAELPFTESENHGGAAGLNMLRLKFK